MFENVLKKYLAVEIPELSMNTLLKLKKSMISRNYMNLNLMTS